jgi:hypothetical protein
MSSNERSLHWKWWGIGILLLGSIVFLIVRTAERPERREGLPKNPEYEVGITGDEVLKIGRSLDSDGDSISNADDNCPAIANPDQRDRDHDGIGDVCETSERADVAIRTNRRAKEITKDESITLQFDVLNNGPRAAKNITAYAQSKPTLHILTCQSSDGSPCTSNGSVATAHIGDLDAGQQTTVSIDVKLQCMPRKESWVFIEVGVPTSPIDGNSNNNYASLSVIPTKGRSVVPFCKE